MCGQALTVLEEADRALPNLTDAEHEALRAERTHYGAMLRLAEGKDAFARNDLKTATEALGEANDYFGSSKIKLILLLLRFAPKLLQGVYQCRNRCFRRSEARA
jgi:predicted negative regulator of RcsB-dependent stress response